MKTLSVPTIPGSEGIIRSEKELKEIAEKIGYPLLLKASSGGGGKGSSVGELGHWRQETFDRGKYCSGAFWEALAR